MLSGARTLRCHPKGDSTIGDRTAFDAAGTGLVVEPRMYQLLRQQHPITDRTAEITFQDRGAEAFAITFG